VTAWRIESDPAFARAQVFKRDHGVCCRCGTDTYSERGRAVFGEGWTGKAGLDGGRIAWPGLLGQYQVERAARFREAVERLHIPRGRWHADWWDMNHRVPLAEGGSRGMDNLESLCVACHRAETAALAARLAEERRVQHYRPEDWEVAVVAILKECPECGGELQVRKNKATKDEFLGCERWPRCTHTEPVPESVRMRLAGAPILPGFE
jgi:5-methylcytosine-specific restriction endonuclease McrA